MASDAGVGAEKEKERVAQRGEEMNRAAHFERALWLFQLASLLRHGLPRFFFPFSLSFSLSLAALLVG